MSTNTRKRPVCPPAPRRLRGAFLAGAVVRGAEIDGANLAGTDLRGALGITSQQVCSALHGRLALMDPDLAAEVQLRCASSQ